MEVNDHYCNNFYFGYNNKYNVKTVLKNKEYKVLILNRKTEWLSYGYNKEMQLTKAEKLLAKDTLHNRNDTRLGIED